MSGKHKEIISWEIKMKAPKLNTKTLADYKKLRASASELENSIADRITYVLDTIYKTFGSSCDNWYFDGAEEGQLGDVNRHVDHHEVSGIIAYSKKPSGQDMAVILNNGDEWGLDEGFPTHWLFEDFEQELKDGKEKFLKKEAERKELEKAKRDSKKQKDADLAAKAKAKLSKAELAALKSTL